MVPKQFMIIAALLVSQWGMSAAANEMVVYKSPTCGCCTKWIEHLQQHGFSVKAHDVESVVPYKKQHGVLPELGSCHTAIIDGYVIEGHVPAADIKRLLKQRPKVTGLAVPAMPVGSPGMEMGKRKDPYNVLSFKREGSIRVFSKYNQ